MDLALQSEPIGSFRYFPKVLENGQESPSVSNATSSGGEIPPLIQKALDQARGESKNFVLVQGTGDN